MTSPSPDMEFRATIELILFVLGGSMTVGVIVFAIWLVRQMFREERNRQKEAQSGPDDDRGAA